MPDIATGGRGRGEGRDQSPGGRAEEPTGGFIGAYAVIIKINRGAMCDKP